ncbi:hypothetical protein [Bacteroides caecimuris]|uniref:hypothetical protein n=1 Tax=Bacteroides caecimuris TaxID=1796613 RepID=UPI0025701727|nr:hypothetical protein [Bacteroides caecimuris]
MEEFEKAVLATHKNNEVYRKQYLEEIQKVKVLFGMQNDEWGGIGMSPKSIIYKLNELKELNVRRLTDSQKEALNKAIESVERHRVAKEYDVKQDNVIRYHCPNCSEFMGFRYSIINMPFNYCHNCGQKLRLPKEEKQNEKN